MRSRKSKPKAAGAKKPVAKKRATKPVKPAAGNRLFSRDDLIREHGGTMMELVADKIVETMYRIDRLADHAIRVGDIDNWLGQYVALSGALVAVERHPALSEKTRG